MIATHQQLESGRKRVSQSGVGWMVAHRESAALARRVGSAMRRQEEDQQIVRNEAAEYAWQCALDF
jgi:hypothetical protein